VANIASIPVGVPFLPALTEAILKGRLPIDGFAPDIATKIAADPFALSDIKVLLPTRRAARALKAAFGEVTDGAPML